jgi:hypothetical protein
MPVTLFVDNELLGALSGFGPSEGVQSLTQAVKSRIGGERSGRMFDSIRLETFQWRNDGAKSFPPCLPLLAACVLAATHMVSEGGIASSNYYRRFRDLLDLSGSGEPEGYGDVVPLLWHQLSWWLDVKMEGRVGKSTVRAHPTLAYIGFALSQALFRETDRRRLTEFFRWLGLKPGETVGEEELLSYFRVWPGVATLGPGIRRMLSEELYADDLARILSATAARWNGVVVDEAGRKTGQLVMVLDLSPPPSVGFMAERPAGFPAQARFRAGDDEVVLTASAEGWYDEVLPVDAEALEVGATLRLTGYRLAWRPRSVIPMRTEPALGRWSSVGHVMPSEAHCLLVRENEVDEVERFLKHNASAGWRPRTASGVIPAGWRLFTDVFIESPPAGTTGEAIACLVPSVGERPTLRGGLRLSGGYNTYLRGGEPDLWVPARNLGDEPIEITLVHSDIAEPLVHRFPSEGGKATLRMLGLPPGSQSVTLGPSTVSFQTIETIGETTASEAGSIANDLVADRDAYAATTSGAALVPSALALGQVRVCGALITGDEANLPPSKRPPLIALNRDEEFVVLGATPGQIERGARPTSPNWPEGLDLRPIGYEVHPRFEPVWILTRTRLGGLQARLRNAIEPSPVPPDDLSSDDVVEWGKQLLREPTLRDESAEPLWNRYVAVAKALLP